MTDSQDAPIAARDTETATVQLPDVLAKTRFFTDQISTSCGTAWSASGPFYCPAD